MICNISPNAEVLAVALTDVFVFICVFSCWYLQQNTILTRT